MSKTLTKKTANSQELKSIRYTHRAVSDRRGDGYPVPASCALLRILAILWRNSETIAS